MSWFGEVPIEKAFYNEMNPRSAIPQVVNLIVNDAVGAMNILPESWMGIDKYTISKGLMQGVSYSQQIIGSGLYSLKSISDNFVETDKEIIWGFNKGINADLNQSFDKGSFVPVIRLTEIYLTSAEAMIKNNNSDDAIDLINRLNSSKGYSIMSSITPEDVYKLWVSEMKMEGNSFLVMKRFNKAMSLLQNDAARLLLPVPLTALIENQMLTQNVGY